MTISVVLADANILFSRTLRDYFLYSASAGAIDIRWSQSILDEMSRNLQRRLGLKPSATARLEELMNSFIECALIDINPSHVVLAENVAMDAKDRHVLAAALSADADVLLTNNGKDFPRQWMAYQDIKLLSASELLIWLAEHHPDELCEAHKKAVQLSPKTESEVLTTLQKCTSLSTVRAVQSVVN